MFTMTEVTVEPDAFDCVVLGTGLPESLIAGAAAVAGKRVLHLDHEAHYGAQYASLSFPALLDWIARRQAAAADGPAGTGCDGADADGRFGSAARAVDPAVGDASLYGPLQVDDPLGDAGRELLGNLRRYSLDVCGPKMAYSAGGLVDTLVRSGAHQYLEFKALEATLILTPTGLVSVPSSRAELFRDRSLGAVDKRMLMRFLQAVVEARGDGVGAGGRQATQESSDSAEASIAPQSGRDALEGGVLERPHEPFVDTLRRFKLSAALQRIVLYALALVPEDQEAFAGRGIENGVDDGAVTAAAGVAAVRLHLQSTGRYGAGHGAFLLPLYGAGELPQAFCRLAAVKGAVYVLRRAVHLVQPLPLSSSTDSSQAHGGCVDPPVPANAQIATSTSADPQVSGQDAEVADGAPRESTFARAVPEDTQDGGGDAQMSPPPPPPPPPPALWALRTRGGQRLTASTLVVNSAYTAAATAEGVMEGGHDRGGATTEGVMEGKQANAQDKKVARCICITDRSLVAGKQQALVVRAVSHPVSGLMDIAHDAQRRLTQRRWWRWRPRRAQVMPPGADAGRWAVHAVQVGEALCAAPSGRYVVYLSTRCDGDAAAGTARLQHAATRLFRRWMSPDKSQAEAKAEGEAGSIPTLLWAVYYTQRIQVLQGEGRWWEGEAPAAVCTPPDDAVDLCAAVDEAEQRFAALFPGEAFYPAPPPDAAGAAAEQDEDEELSRIVDKLGEAQTPGD